MKTQGLSFFEKYLTLWVGLCIGAGIALGKAAPGVATFLDGLAIRVDDARRERIVALLQLQCRNKTTFFADINFGVVDVDAVARRGRTVHDEV